MFDPSTVRILTPGTGEPVTELVVPGKGTWSVDPDTGAVTFTPQPSAPAPAAPPATPDGLAWTGAELPAPLGLALTMLLAGAVVLAARRCWDGSLIAGGGRQAGPGWSWPVCSARRIRTRVG